MLQNIKNLITALLPKTRKSNPVSKLLRPIFENKRLPSILGVQLIAGSMLASFAVYPTQAFDPAATSETVITAETNQILTETTFRYPLDQSLGVSQGYYLFHRGIDIRAPYGTPIYPVANGMVSEVRYTRYGYGYYVVVNHGQNVESLYAHMGRIDVTPGEQVSKETQLGTVGMTGRTTGSHLHLEMIVDGRTINPLGQL